MSYNIVNRTTIFSFLFCFEVFQKELGYIYNNLCRKILDTSMKGFLVGTSPLLLGTMRFKLA